MSWVSVAGHGVAKADSETVKLHHHLTLRRARSARLEGWATPRLHPTLRDAPLRGAPQGEVMKWNMLWYQIICRSVVGSSTRIASRAARNFPDARPIQQTLASGDDLPAEICPKRVDLGLFAPRRGAAKAGPAGRDTIACSAVGDGSIAVTSAHVSLIRHARPPRATTLT